MPLPPNPPAGPFHPPPADVMIRGPAGVYLPGRKPLMGHRANLILIGHGRYDLYYTHWRANTLDRDLFWGPEYAGTFIRAQQPCDETGWLDDVWAEGGAVVDFDAKVLLMFGGEDILYDVSLRRTYLDLLAEPWRGWEVRWAHEGIADLAGYVGYPRSNVLTPPTEPLPGDVPLNFRLPSGRGRFSCVGTMRFEGGGTTIYPIFRIARAALDFGPRLVATARAANGFARLDLAESSDDAPASGFHIDVPATTVEFWTAKYWPDAAARVAHWRPGWTVRWHRDRYEFQLERAGGRLIFPPPDRERLERQLVETLLTEDRQSGVDTLIGTAEALRQHGHEVTNVNPLAGRDARLMLPRRVREGIVNAAVAVSRER